MFPLLKAELVDKRQWLTEEKLMDYYSIGQSTPGIIAVNVATFTGYTHGGLLGAIVATVSLVAMPIIIILSLANVLSLYMENPYVSKAFSGIRIVVVALIAESVCKLWSAAVKSKVDLLFFITALGLAVSGLPIVVIMAIFCGLGFVLGWKRGWK